MYKKLTIDFNYFILGIVVKLQNKISHLFLTGSVFLQDREEKVLKDASERLGFKPTKLIDKSSWWNSEIIGALIYEGKFKGKKAVLKIQGVKPTTSEIYMIQSFSKANRSKILRPPLLYSYLPWDDEKMYEALVLEFVSGKKIVNSPTNENELEEFFALRAEYKKNCAVNPWIDKPKESLGEEIRTNFAKWKEASFKLYPNTPFREREDEKIINEAVSLLEKNYQGVEREFQHGHFAANDLLKTSDGSVVVLSNLYWSFKPPFYDAVFGYHWFIYYLASLESITIKLIEKQRSLWFSKINNLVKTKQDKKLLNLAFLERAAAGLNLDVLSIDVRSPVAGYLVSKTREILKALCQKYTAT